MNQKISDKQLSFLDTEEELEKNSFSDLCLSLGVDLTPGWIDRFGAAILSWSKESLPRRIRTLSLFSGAGGLDIGFHDAGFSVEAMIEIESRFSATLTENSGKDKYFGDVKVLNLDIRKYSPEKDLTIDFIIGGPPCQPFSAAGRRAAGVRGTSDEDGQLFEEYVRLLKILKPKGFLFENVYGITGAENGQAWTRIKDSFQKAGYLIYYRILDAADYGVPQHRERMFIVGVQNGEFKFPYPTHGPDAPSKLPHVTALEALNGVDVFDKEKLGSVGGRYGHLLEDVPPGLNYSYFTERMGHPQPIFAWRSKFSDFLYKADPDRPVRTLKAQIGQYSGPFHWKNRAFTVAEFKRLQTFPDGYQIIGGRQAAIHQIGNSVPPQLARILALSILEQVFDIHLPIKLPKMESGTQLSFRRRKQSLTDHYRNKAETAIEKINGNGGSVKVKKRIYKALLGDDFRFVQNSEKSNIEITFSPSAEKWVFNSQLLSGKSTATSFSVFVEPVFGSSWTIPVDKVELLGSSLTREAFVGVWKAFEKELAHLKIKADLVQLSGYYQYAPALKSSMLFTEGEPTEKEWEIVGLTVEGVAVGKTLSYVEIAKIWKVSAEQVLMYSKWLRSLGYEVRNQKTNPQMPNDSLLIPYSFPTLTNMSVQLRKSLED